MLLSSAGLVFDAKIGAKERGPKLGYQFFGGIRLVSKTAF